jgi:2,3-bisphosphoglycerate-dependent phosphoglycerate mutase
MGKTEENLKDVSIQETEGLAVVKKGTLVIVRHQESEWNKKGLWTGSRDINLTPYGFEKSKELGLKVHDIPFDNAFASMQVRSIETLSCMLDVDCEYNVPTEHSAYLNERDYGDYTGKNKWDMEKNLGEEEFDKIRRGWNVPIPNGETLKMVYERVVPFYLEKILPLLRIGKNVLVVSHGNAIRALMKYIEKISDEDIASVEMIFGGILIYEVDKYGCMIHKEVRSIESSKKA